MHVIGRELGQSDAKVIGQPYRAYRAFGTRYSRLSGEVSVLEIMMSLIYIRPKKDLSLDLLGSETLSFLVFQSQSQIR